MTINREALHLSLLAMINELTTGTIPDEQLSRLDIVQLIDYLGKCVSLTEFANLERLAKQRKAAIELMAKLDDTVDSKRAVLSACIFDNLIPVVGWNWVVTDECVLECFGYSIRWSTKDDAYIVTGHGIYDEQDTEFEDINDAVGCCICDRAKRIQLLGGFIEHNGVV